MKRPNLLALLIAVLFGVTNAWAGALVIPNTYSTGETITASSFNADNDAIETWAAGNIGSDNITDASVASIDITNGTIVAADVFTDTLTASEIAANAIAASELADDAVDTAAILAANVTTPKIAVDATTAVYLLEEGTMTAGSCSTPITMDVDDTRPTDNTVLKQSIDPDDTTFADESILVNVMVRAECVSSCGSALPQLNVSCNWDATDDAFVASFRNVDAITLANADYPIPMTYMNTYTPSSGTAADVFCVVWEDGVTSQVWDYCARMIVQHIKR